MSVPANPALSPVPLPHFTGVLRVGKAADLGDNDELGENDELEDNDELGENDELEENDSSNSTLTVASVV